MLSCPFCRAALQLPAEPAPELKCSHCGAAIPIPGGMEGFLVDRDQDGRPDALPGPEPEASSFAPLDPSTVPSAPRRPNARVQRLLLRYEGGQGVRMIIGLVFMFLGCVASLVFLFDLPKDLALDLKGQEVSGTLSSCDTLENVTINDEHPVGLLFSFELEGRSHEGESYVLGEYDCIPGRSLSVEVLPGSPSIARVSGSTISPAGWVPIFVLIFPITGFLLAGSAFRDNQRDKVTYRDGRPLVARVEFRGPDTSTKINGRHPYLLRWSFTREGRKYKGKYSVMEPIAEMRGGDEVLILVHPRDPRKNVLWIAEQEP